MSDAEETEGLPVLAEEVTAIAVDSGAGLAARQPVAGMVPAVQAAAAAAGGFVAGAAVVGLVHRRGRRRALAQAARRGGLLRRGRSGSRAAGAPAELLQIVGSRSLLLDVHLLGGSGAER